jgi:hypothetical protein
MNNLRLARKILKIIGLKAKVVYGNEYCVEFFKDGSAPVITIVNEKMSLDKYEVISHEIFERNFHMPNTNPYIMSMLHEIGHAKLNHTYCAEYVDEREKIAEMLRAGVVDVVRANELYSNLKYEYDANIWAANFYYDYRNRLELN